MGVLYAAGEHVRQSYGLAARWYTLAAKQGVAAALYNLAFLHFRGLGVDRDPVRAVQLLEQAAEHGMTDAAWALYRQYSGGEYLPVDSEEATDWLMRAAELGKTEAAQLLIKQLGSTQVGAPPTERVVELLAKCAGQSPADVQASLGLLYFEGKHVPQDQGQALHWFTRAAEGGNAFAQAWLGDVHIQGLGVKVDRDNAARRLGAG